MLGSLWLMRRNDRESVTMLLWSCCTLFQAEIAQLQEELALKDAEIERLQCQLSRTSSHSEVAERGKRRGIIIKNPKCCFNFTLVTACLSISKQYKEMQESTYRIYFGRKNGANLFCLLVEAFNVWNSPFRGSTNYNKYLKSTETFTTEILFIIWKSHCSSVGIYFLWIPSKFLYKIFTASIF